MRKGRRSRCVAELCTRNSRKYTDSLQITRRIKRTLQKSVVEHNVAERKKWAKFGQEKGHPPGPDRATTTVGEELTLKLSAGNKVRPENHLVAERFPERSGFRMRRSTRPHHKI